MRQEPHRLVFIDETSVKTTMTRFRGRAPLGQSLKAAAPFGKWRTQTFIAGLTSDALIAPWIIPGAMNGDAFATYIETQLAPELQPGTVVYSQWWFTDGNGSALSEAIVFTINP